MSQKFLNYGKIYKITNKINGKIYIGQTVRSLEQRWNAHCNRSKSPNIKTAIAKAIQKYSAQNFIIEELCYCSNQEDLNLLEIYFIKKENCLAPNGYNLTNGGLNGKKSPEAKKHMSEAKLGKPGAKKGNKYPGSNPNGGLKWRGGEQPPWLKNPEVRAKAAKKATGKKRTGLALENIRRGLSHLKKKVLCLTNNTIYESATSAGIELGLKVPSVISVASGKRNSVYGFKFKYVGNEGVGVGY